MEYDIRTHRSIYLGLVRARKFSGRNSINAAVYHPEIGAANDKMKLAFQKPNSGALRRTGSEED